MAFTAELFINDSNAGLVLRIENSWADKHGK